MESLIRELISKTAALVVILIWTGAIVSVIAGLQEKAFHSKKHGLISLTAIHKQLHTPVKKR